MKIQVVSDLHIEFRRDQKKFKWWRGGVDVLVVAGDACDTLSMERFSDMIKPVLQDGVKVIYIPGNHETYRADDVETYEKRLQDVFAGREGEGLHLLQNSSMTLVDPVDTTKQFRVIGTTLWSDLSNPIDALQVRGWPDFHVKGHDTTRHTNLHKDAVNYLCDQLADSHLNGVPSIVVTHFVPSYRSVHERYKGDLANPYFVTDLEFLMIGPSAPLLWVHGHTHDPFDYICEKTRVVCNPYGYLNEQNNYEVQFDPQKIIQL